MKKSVYLSILALVALVTSCKLESLSYYDDVYSTSTDAQYAPAPSVSSTEAVAPETNYYSEEYVVEEYPEEKSASANYSTSESYYDSETGNTYITNNYYYDDDDYYDYYYTSRIRRFHTHVNYGWGYYDPYYTNMYWYDYNPNHWGVSVYLGYNWYWPTYYYRPYYYSHGYYHCGFNYG